MLLSFKKGGISWTQKIQLGAFPWAASPAYYAKRKGYLGQKKLNFHTLSSMFTNFIHYHQLWSTFVTFIHFYVVVATTFIHSHLFSSLPTNLKHFHWHSSIFTTFIISHPGREVNSRNLHLPELHQLSLKKISQSVTPMTKWGTCDIRYN